MLTNNTIFCITWKIEAVFRCFYLYIFDAPFFYLLEKPIHAFSEQVKYCLCLQCFDIFVEQTKEIMYWKCQWNTALLADMIWTCGQLFLFCLHLCMRTNHNNLNFLLINLIFRSQYFRFQILVSMPLIINLISNI